MVSVGVVAEKDYLYTNSKDLAAIFRPASRAERLDQGSPRGRPADRPVLRDRRILLPLAPLRSEGPHPPGDAFAFLDPVFSCGVFLALYSGEMGANFAEACLTDDDFFAERFVKYGTELCKGIESMRAPGLRLLRSRFSFREFLKSSPR